jgi:hypothetical protein
MSCAAVAAGSKKRAGAGGVATTDPSTLGSIRLRLIRGTGITGDPASAWADQASAGPYDYAQGSASLRPDVSAGDMVFDGTDDEMTQASGTLLTSIVSASAWTWWGVVKLNGAAGTKGANPFNAPAFHAELIEASWSVHVHRTGGVDYVYAQQKGATWTASDATGIAVSQSTMMLVEARYNGTNIYCRIAGTEQSTAVASIAAGSTSVSLALGYGGLYSPCTIADIAVCNTHIDDTTRGEVRAWYAATYGVSV